MPSIKHLNKTYKLNNSIELDGDIWHYDHDRQGYYCHYEFISAEDYLRIENQNAEDYYNHN